MKRLIVLVLLALPIITMAQQQERKFGVKLSGYIKSDIFYDTRQVESAREGHFLLCPAPILYDKDSNDINAKSSFNMLSIQTRLTCNITGPDVLGAETSGLVEGEFFGSTDLDMNGFRLRHAYLKLDWKHHTLLVGQTWHPMFVDDCFPTIVSVNTGAPFQAFSRNPQIRYTLKYGAFNFLVAAMSQRDFASPGGSVSLRNSVMPDVCAQAKFIFKNPDKTREVIFGFGGGYKVLTPRLKTDSGYKTDAEVSGFYGGAFIKVKTKPITVKLEGTCGQNMFNFTMLGGYAIKYDTSAYDLKRNYLNYTNLDNVAGWIDIHSNGEKFQAGVFAGYSYNLGSLYNIQNWNSESSYFTRGRNVLYCYRISPRVLYNIGKVRLALELEYTVAGYGNKINSLGQVSDITDVANLRTLLGVYYFF